jgi:hypothetical protein
MGGNPILSVTGADWSNYRVVADMTVLTPGNGIVFNAQDATHHYMAQLAAGKIDLLKCDGGYSVLKSMPVSYTIGQTARLEIQAYHGIFRFFLNGLLVGEHTDSSFPGGKVGFRYSGSERGLVDNFGVYPEEPVGAPVPSDVLFHDSFESGTMDKWASGTDVTIQPYHWAEVTNNGNPIEALGGAAWKEYSVDFDVLVKNISAEMSFLKNGNNHYMWQFDATKNAINKLSCVNGSYSNIGTIGITLPVNKKIHVSIHALASKIYTYVDGSLVDSMTRRADLTQGTIGLRVSGSAVGVYDNVIVRDMTGISPEYIDLQALVSDASLLKYEQFKTLSWNALQVALAAAQTTLDDKSAMTQDYINAYNALFAAMTPDIADQSKLAALAASTSGLVKETYSSSSWANFETALADANAVLANRDADQSAVDAALTALQSAIDSLVQVKSILTINPNSPVIFGAVKINGGEPVRLPTSVVADTGETISVEPVIIDAIDYKFYSWSGDAASDEPVLNVVMNKDKTIRLNQTGTLNKNLSYTAGVTSSSNVDALPAWGLRNVADGLLISADGTFNGPSKSIGISTVASATRDVNEWIELDLGKDYNFDRIQLHPRTDVLTADGKTASFPENFTIQIKADGASAYTTIDTQTGMTAPVVYTPYVFASADTKTARYIRLNVTRINAALSTDPAAYSLQLAEIAVYDTLSPNKDGLPLPPSVGNPILPLDIYVADGEPHVWDDGRLYIYGSHDELANGYCGPDHFVYSTDDMVNWVDHGRSFYLYSGSTGTVTWNSGAKLWAPDVVFKDGLYYLYFCLPDFTDGMAESPYPYGPFVNPRKIDTSPEEGNDPAAFVDDDGKAYFYFGMSPKPNGAKGGQLEDDMFTIKPGTLKNNLVTLNGTDSFFEASSMRKFNGVYYLVYAGPTGGPVQLRYATSTVSPLGPFTYRGILIDVSEGGSSNNVHGGLFQFDGKYYLAYHRSSRGNTSSRRFSIEPVTINPDGTIDRVYITSSGPFAPFPADSRIEAERAAQISGPNQSPIEAASADSGAGLEKLGSIKPGNYASFKYVDFGTSGTSRVTSVTARASSTSSANKSIEVRLDSTSGPLIATIPIGNTGNWNTYEDFTAPIFEDASGARAVYLLFKGDGSADIMNLNWFTFGTTELEDLAEINMVRSGDSITATYEVYDKEGDTTEALLVLAVYDADGKLKDANIRTVPVAGDGVTKETITIPFTTDNVKAFIFDGATYVPLCAALDAVEPPPPTTDYYTYATGVIGGGVKKQPTYIEATDHAGAWFGWDAVVGDEYAAGYSLTMYYGNNSLDLPSFRVTVNGEDIGSIVLPKSGNWAVQNATATIDLPLLEPGAENEILFYFEDNGGANVSQISVTTYYQ